MRLRGTNQKHPDHLGTAQRSFSEFGIQITEVAGSSSLPCPPQCSGFTELFQTSARTAEPSETGAGHHLRVGQVLSPTGICWTCWARCLFGLLRSFSRST